MRRWVISDTHWNHNKIIEYEGRPENYQERTIDNWCRLVQPEDIVYHLGDVIIYHKEILGDILCALPGRKVLVRGNHDSQSPTWYEKRGFDICVDSLTLGQIIMTHRPLPHVGEGYLNLHGHLHLRKHRPNEGELCGSQHRLFSLELEGYQPVLLEKLAMRGRNNGLE